MTKKQLESIVVFMGLFGHPTYSIDAINNKYNLSLTDSSSIEDALEAYLEFNKIALDKPENPLEPPLEPFEVPNRKTTELPGIKLIAEERNRQIEVENWAPEHDLMHTTGELANAAAYYALTNDMIDFMDLNWGNDMHLNIWPFELNHLKRIPEDRIRDLQKAGALIAAELDRLIALKNLV